MKNVISKNSIEFILFFILYPIFLYLPIPLNYKLYTVPFVFIYVVSISYIHRKELFKKRKPIKPHNFWRTTGIRFLGVAVASVAYILLTNKDLLFSAIINEPITWLKMILVYTFFSVFPQEYIYRVFYLYRYQHLFKTKWSLYIVNALIFSLGHLMFNNSLVLVITFIGGFLFMHTYQKTKSMFWVSVEHLIYGGWLFTVGMGKMLGFPI